MNFISPAACPSGTQGAKRSFLRSRSHRRTAETPRASRPAEDRTTEHNGAHLNTMGHKMVTLGRTACSHTACSQEPAGGARGCWAPPPPSGPHQIQGLLPRPQSPPPRGGLRAASAFVGSGVRRACCVDGRCELGRESRPFAGPTDSPSRGARGSDVCACWECAESGEGRGRVSASISTPEPGALDFRSTPAPAHTTPPFHALAQAGKRERVLY